jgi:hypothetical protein
VTSVSDEPALRFWLRYVEREGALVERAIDHALVLLPPQLQRANELPEEVVVTANPDLAREESAVLLIAGHPAAERAAASLLAEGDTGHAYLPWPQSLPPTRSTLEAHAREWVAVEHGRIDASAEPIAAYAPLLRVGAMLRYVASLTLHFAEQEEAWVDATTGLPLSEGMLRALRDTGRLCQPTRRHRELPANLSLALPSVHAQLEQRASARKAALAAQSRRALESELGRADAYYRSALESIARRRSSAEGDRLGLLDAQAETTRAEHARRRREIEHEHQARHELKPFRLHLVHAPALVLPISIRRGNRSFSSTLTWLPLAKEFAAVRCPACGAAAEPLVAARDELGCASCKPNDATRRFASPTADTTAAARPPDDDRPAAKPPAAFEAPSLRQRRAAGSSPRGNGLRQGVASPDERPQGPFSARPSAQRDLDRTGNKLALGFWQRLTLGHRWPGKKIARDSPLSALYRLYGQAGPLYALGIPPGDLPKEASAMTCPSTLGVPELTVGQLLAGNESYPYSLFWQLEAGRAVACELMPAPLPLALQPACGKTAGIGARLRGSAPAPAVELDPVAAALWQAELEQNGLPFVVRCLATWWRSPADVATGEPEGAVAAAISGAVARAAGMRRTKADVAAIYGVNPAAAERVASALAATLRLDRARGW